MKKLERASGEESNPAKDKWYPVLGVSVCDEHRGVRELEGGADGVDGGDQDDAVGDEGEGVPHADEAVEEGVHVGHGGELLRGAIPDDPPECRPETTSPQHWIGGGGKKESGRNREGDLQRGDEEHEGEDVPCKTREETVKSGQLLEDDAMA